VASFRLELSGLAGVAGKLTGRSEALGVELTVEPLATSVLTSEAGGVGLASVLEENLCAYVPCCRSAGSLSLFSP
jgi:hypothetical protein